MEMRKQKTKYKVKAKIELEPHDLWVGLYWDYHKLGLIKQLNLSFCVVPMLPLHITIIQCKLPLYLICKTTHQIIRQD